MRLLLLRSGGTIAMKRGGHGLEPADDDVAEETSRLVAETFGDDLERFETIALSPQIDSSQATPETWNRLARLLAERRDEFDAFLLTHGTDTMAYSAAALAFALEGWDKPVVMTGAMRPLSERDGDAPINLRDAVAATRSATEGVWLQFGGRLMHGARVRKVHSRDADAFRAAPSDAPPRRQGDGFILRDFRKDAKATAIPIVPGMDFSPVAEAAEAKRGVLLACYGAGGAPDDPILADALKTARTRGVPILAISQCAEGGVELGAYAASKRLVAEGAIDGGDIAFAAAYVKMLAALSEHDAPEARRDALKRVLCGEMMRRRDD